MSLTRAEWLKMWETIQRIQGCAYAIQARTRSGEALGYAISIVDYTQEVKEQIQSVVGQLE